MSMKEKEKVIAKITNLILQEQDLTLSESCIKIGMLLNIEQSEIKRMWVNEYCSSPDSRPLS